jgi:hypothetical protein
MHGWARPRYADHWLAAQTLHCSMGSREQTDRVGGGATDPSGSSACISCCACRYVVLIIFFRERAIARISLNRIKGVLLQTE